MAQFAWHGQRFHRGLLWGWPRHGHENSTRQIAKDLPAHRTENPFLTPEGLSDGCRVDPTLTRQLIRELLDEGYTSRQLLRELGYKRTDLFMLRSKRVFAKTQLRVEKLYRKAMKEGLAA